MRIRLLYLIGLMLVVGRVFAQSNTTSVVVQNAGIRMQMGGGWRNQGHIDVDGIPLNDHGGMYAQRPNAGGRFFGYEDDPKAPSDTQVTTAPDGTVRAEYPLRAPNHEFMGTQTIEITPDRRLRIQVDAAFSPERGGRYEHRIGGFYTGWLSGRYFIAELNDGTTTEGRFPMQPSTEDLEMSTVFKNFKYAKIASAVGTLEVFTTGTLPFRIADYRRNRAYDAEPIFYLGVSELPVDAGGKVNYGIEFKFPQPRDRSAQPNAAGPVTLDKAKAVATAYEPPAPADIIVPTPKKVKWGAGALEVQGARDSIQVASGNQSDAFVEAEISKIADALTSAAELSRNTTGTASAAGTSGAIQVRLLKELGSNLEPEHYSIRIADRAELTAETTEGLAMGVQTLRQLMRPGRSPGTVALRRCEIDDYATLPFRCIHFFCGAGDSPTHIKLIEQLFEPLKINEICYHADNLKWESHPEIKNPAGNPMAKDEVRKVLAAASRANIDVIPLVASFGHSDWLLTTPELRKLAENPDFPYAYDPTNPAVYKLVEDLYQEAIDLFHPRYFHIGHDEVDLKGFPQTERLKKIGLRKLLADDVWHYRNWFAARGIRTVIWGDMMVGPGESPDATLAPSVEEARLRRESLPKDVLIGDWHYVSDPAPAYKSLRIFNRAGFDTVAVTWMHPLNVTNFARAAAEANEPQPHGDTNTTTARQGKSLGLLHSTWSGSKTNDEVIRKNIDQYATYVLAAEASWNGGSMRPDQLPYDFRKYFSELWIRDMLPTEKRPGWVANGDRKPAQLLACRFGSFLLPKQVTVPIESTATLLLFDVGATSAGPMDPPIATATISYDDGTSESIPWRIGYNVMGQEDKRSAPGAILINPQAHSGSWIHRYAYRPKAATIKQIVFDTTNQGPGLVVHRITGVQ